MIYLDDQAARDTVAEPGRSGRPWSSGDCDKSGSLRSPRRAAAFRRTIGKALSATTRRSGLEKGGKMVKEAGAERGIGQAVLSTFAEAAADDPQRLVPELVPMLAGHETVVK
jgi:hypothetical protein